MEFMKKVTIIFLLFFIFIFGVNAFAQEGQDSYDMSFEQAYELMFVNNNSLKAAMKAKDVARHQKNAALGLYSPKVGINTTVAMLDHDIAMHVNMTPLAPVTKTMTLQNKNLWEASGAITWNIFTGGKIIAANQAASAKYKISDYKLEEVKGNLTSDLIKRYYGVCLAQDVVKVRQDVYDATKKHLEDAKKYEKEGFIAHSETLHAEVAFAKADRELKASKRDLQVVNDALIRLVKAQNVDLDGVSVNPTSRLFIYKNDLPDIEVIKNDVLANSPLIKQSEGKNKVVNANYKAKLADYSPIVTVGACDIFANDSLSPLVPRMAFAATANWMVFDGFSRLNNVKAAKALKSQVEFEHADIQTTLMTYADKLYNELLKAKEQYESTDSSIKSAEEAVRVTTLSFKEGFSTSLSVTDAQVALSAEKIDRLNALYKFDIALIELLRLEGQTGKIFEYINNSETEQL